MITKESHSRNSTSTTNSAKVKPAWTNRSTEMEEMEDKDIKKAKEKARLNKGSTHIIEPSDEEDTKKPSVP